MHFSQTDPLLYEPPVLGQPIAIVIEPTTRQSGSSLTARDVDIELAKSEVPKARTWNYQLFECFQTCYPNST